MLFRQLFDLDTGTYTYLLADPDSNEAILIDPVYEQARRDMALINELGLKLLYTVETHVHADHVTGGWALREALGSQIALADVNQAKGMDVGLSDGDQLKFGSRYVTVRSTPGHTKGCLTFVTDTEDMAFTGDALLIRGCGRTDFQGGDAGELYKSIHTKIFTLPDGCVLYPGHDYKGLTSTSVAEEKAHNPRLGGQLSQNDFVGYMDNLGLPHPKRIDIAVPANLKCGEPDVTDTAEPATWADLTLTFAGILEVQPQWLAENSEHVQIVDVRETAEFNGALGHLAGSISIPLGELEGRVDDLDKNKPIVTFCRAGGRSAQATVILRRAGFKDMASLAGGMLRWRGQGYAAEGSSD